MEQMFRKCENKGLELTYFHNSLTLFTKKSYKYYLNDGEVDSLLDGNCCKIIFEGCGYRAGE